MLEPLQPIARTARVMCQGERFDFIADNAKENCERKARHSDPANIRRVFDRKLLRVLANSAYCLVDAERYLAPKPGLRAS